MLQVWVYPGSQRCHQGFISLHLSMLPSCQSHSQQGPPRQGQNNYTKLQSYVLPAWNFSPAPKERFFYPISFFLFFFFSACRLSLIAVSGGYSLLRCVGSRHLGFSRCGSGLSSSGSKALELRLSCSVACGIFLDQGSKLYLLHWQADSDLECHKRTPREKVFCPPRISQQLPLQCLMHGREMR